MSELTTLLVVGLGIPTCLGIVWGAIYLVGYFNERGER